MTTIDVNTGRFIGKGKSLEETVTWCNLEASEEIAASCDCVISVARS